MSAVLDLLRNSMVFEYLSVHLGAMGYIVTFPLAVFLFRSYRMNRRLEPPAPGAPKLLQLSQSLMAQEGTNQRGARKKLVWLLQKTNWLFYEKLKLLPNEHIERRANFFYLFLASSLVSLGLNWVHTDSKTARSLEDVRYVNIASASMVQPELWVAFLLTSLVVLLLALPIVLVKKNREFYFDVFALMTLWWAAFYKLIRCLCRGCCYGIPWSWGIYNQYLDTIVIPVQFFEFAVGFLLSIACILYMLYGKTYRQGYGCSFCLLSFAVPRFFWEYLRYTGDTYRSAEANVIFGLSMVQVICIGAVVICIAWPFLLPLEKRLLDKF